MNYEYLLESFPGIFAVLNTKYKVLVINKNLADLLGILPEKVKCYIGKDFYEDILPLKVNVDIIRECKKSVDTAFKTRFPHQQSVFKFKDVRLPLSPERYWSITNYPVIKQDGSFDSIIHWIVDVTEIKGAEERFNILSEISPHMVWEADPFGEFIFVNKTWIDYTGLTLNESLGKSWVKVVPSESLNFVDQSIRNACNNKIMYEFEVLLKRGRDGEYRWHKAIGVPVIIPNTDRVLKWIGLAIDIHEFKIAISNLNIEQELREKFVATLTHDLRGPLMTAKLSAQLIQRSAENVAVILSIIPKLTTSIDRADRMIRDLLDANSIQAKGLTLVVTQMDMSEMLRELKEELTLLYGDRILLETPSRVIGYWDKNALIRMVENLVGNAIKYGSQNTQVKIIVKEEMDSVKLIVHNDGNPLDKKDIEEIFIPFQRGETSQGKVKGWGLGLTLVKGVTEAHGGRVEVVSSQQKGTDFSINLPKDWT